MWLTLSSGFAERSRDKRREPGWKAVEDTVRGARCTCGVAARRRAAGCPWGQRFKVIAVPGCDASNSPGGFGAQAWRAFGSRGKRIGSRWCISRAHWPAALSKEQSCGSPCKGSRTGGSRCPQRGCAGIRTCGESAHSRPHLLTTNVAAFLDYRRRRIDELLQSRGTEIRTATGELEAASPISTSSRHLAELAASLPKTRAFSQAVASVSRAPTRSPRSASPSSSMRYPAERSTSSVARSTRPSFAVANYCAVTWRSAAFSGVHDMACSGTRAVQAARAVNARAATTDRLGYRFMRSYPVDWPDGLTNRPCIRSGGEPP